MKQITDVTSEREFIRKLRSYYRKTRRKGYPQNEISFLALMEYTGTATSEFEYYSEKYFSVGIHVYDWQQGNSLLRVKINEWEAELAKEQTAKQQKQIIQENRAM